MKNILKAILPIIALGAVLTSCKDWTEPEAMKVNQPEPKSAEYYENLRAYKKSDHPIAFGWFGGWTATGTTMASSMAGLPDSVDMISIWGNWRNPSAVKLADMHYVQKVKGTKVLMCFIVSSLGDQLLVPEGYREDPLLWWADSTQGNIDSLDGMAYAIRKYARAIVDTVNLYGYDGFDIDYEPNYGADGNIAYPYSNMSIFIDEIGKYLGPLSGTGKILTIDGEPDKVQSAYGDRFSFYISQAYHSTGAGDLQSRMNGMTHLKNFDTKKYIVTENFESFWRAGGNPNFKTKDGQTVPSILGMAGWNPNQGRKGGCGTFHMEYEFAHDPDYKWLRQAIQIQNPAVH